MVTLPTAAVATRVVAGLVMCAVVALTACNGNADTPTSPTTATTTTTTVPATTSEEFVGTLAVGGSSFYSFTVSQNGTVNLTLTTAGGAGVPATVWLGLGIGTPSGEDCATTTTVNTPPGATAQVTGTYAPGVYCAKVFDIGNLFGPVRFAVTIAYP